MENSIYLALSRQMALKTNMDMIANNIANANTSGYRAQNLMFQEYLSEQDVDTIDKEADDDLSFVYNSGQYQNETQGTVKFTGNPLDVALNGPGFFGVQGPNGEQMYTRSGRFQIDAGGTLTTANGDPVTDAGGANITIPEGSTEISIDDGGVVSNQDGQIGQIGVFEFANVQELEPRGNTLYRSPNGGQPAQNTVIKQGMLESSNVETIVEITRMVETLRDFQATQNILRTENDRMRGMIQRLTGGNS